MNFRVLGSLGSRVVNEAISRRCLWIETIDVFLHLSILISFGYLITQSYETNGQLGI